MTAEHKGISPKREKIIMDQQRVEAMIARPGNRIRLNREKRQCGDDRSNENGALSIFGGDALPMQVLATMNTGMTPEEIVGLIIHINTARDQKTFFHTDTHADKTNPKDIGCGQLKKPSLPENEKLYAMDEQHVLKAADDERIIAELNKQAEENPDHVVRQELQGDHVAGGVIFNTGEENTINHDDGTDSAFVVDTKMAEKYLREMFAAIAKQKPELADREEEFMKVADHLTNTTAHLLAQDLPTFEVNLDEEKPKVKHIGTVA